MRWVSRRQARSATRRGEVSAGRPMHPGAGDPEPAVDRLSVDGTVLPVRTAIEELEQDVRAGRLALLRTEFLALSTTADPIFVLHKAGVGNVTPLCTLCCLRCSARHSLSAVYARSLTGPEPVAACQRCGCPDAVLVYDPAALTRPDAPYDLRRVSGAGTRVKRVWIWSSSDDLGPEVVDRALVLVDQGEEFAEARITTLTIPPGYEDVEKLATVVAFRENLALDRLVWVQLPPHGDVLVALVTSG